jgi:hypothetical protein
MCDCATATEEDFTICGALESCRGWPHLLQTGQDFAQGLERLMLEILWMI